MAYAGPVPRNLTDAEKAQLADGTIPRADEMITYCMNQYKVSAVTQMHIRKLAYARNVELFAEQFKDEDDVSAKAPARYKFDAASRGTATTNLAHG